MDPEKRRKVLHKIGLPAVTAHTITHRDALEAELLKVQENGYAFEDQELRTGVRRVAAPIYGFHNHLAGCIGIAATILSFGLDHREDLGHMALQTAKKISYRMGKQR